MVSLNLLVLRAHNIEATRTFYEMLDMRFVREQHGRGPVHYSTHLGNLVMEIYPGDEPSTELRLGLLIDDMNNLVQRLPTEVMLSKPEKTEQGWRLLLVDPDGRKVEISCLDRGGDE